MIKLNHYNRLPQKLPVAPIKIPVTRSASLPSDTPANTPIIETPEEVPVPATPMTQRSKSQPKSRGRPKKASVPTASDTEASVVDTPDHQQDLLQL